MQFWCTKTYITLGALLGVRIDLNYGVFGLFLATKIRCIAILGPRFK